MRNFPRAGCERSGSMGEKPFTGNSPTAFTIYPQPLKGAIVLPELNRETAFKLLGKMLKIRLAEEGIAEKYSQQKMRCPTHLSIGQEAVAAAVGLCLRKEDQVFSTHRAHA